MNIKKLVLVGILAVIIVGGIGAYMFLYPKEEKVSRAVVAPKALPPVAAPVAPPPVAVPVSTPVAVPSAPSRIAAPVTPPPAATPVVATPVQVLQQPLKLSKSFKTAKAKPERSKSADLRDCLKLETNEAIAKCAGE